MKTWHMWVKHSDPKVDVILLMQRCDPVLQRFSSVPKAPPPRGVPVLDPDGTIEVRSYNEMGYIIAKRYLEEQGFTIEREKEND